MVISTILAFFLNNVLNSAYYFFKLWISHFYNIYRITHLFILLSGVQTFISNVIYGGERSLNRTSIPSRLMQPQTLEFYIIYWVLPNNKIYPQRQLPTTQILVTCSMTAGGAGGGWGLLVGAGQDILDAVGARQEGGVQGVNLGRAGICKHM